MSGPDVEGVLAGHGRIGNHCRCGAFVAGGARLDSHFDDDVRARHRAHVAAAVRAEVRAWLESKVWEGPLTTNRAALAALAECVGQVASVGEGEG